ncbi:MAG: toprim domain-containing protein [Flavobacteriaceae bacterium]|nr:toprim domain-containing protein [Flavobacteriaceae bacterium]
MNCQQANELNIVDYLSKSGIQPATTRGRNLVYLSPIRSNEKTASFFVYPDQNRWHDYGSGTGGKMIDLVCQMNQVGIPGALLILSGVELPAKSFSFARQKEETLPEPTLEILHIQQLQNKALVQYIEARGIPASIAAKYTKEAYYAITNSNTGEIKKYFAMAFAYDRGGFELRNKYFKGGNSPKAITTIPGNLQKVNVFEGWIDFLSCLAYYRQPALKNTTIVLNSVSHLKQLFDILPNFNEAFLFLDNDSSGLKATNEIISRFPFAINQSARLFPDHKDFNDFLISDQLHLNQ